MISPPTDRLHKFLAIGGVALVIGSVTVPLQKYQNAETQRIEALTRAREVQFAYQRYADHVNRISVFGTTLSLADFRARS